MSDQLKKEKEMMTRFRGQVVDRTKYDEVVTRLRDAEAKAHHLKHDSDFRATETTKLLSRKRSLCLSLSLSLSLTLSLSLSHSLSVCLSVCLSLSLCLALCLSL